MPGPRVVACPQCGKPVEWTAESKWRPFCSERCKLLDFGGWASERYRVPTEELPDDSGADEQDADDAARS